MLRTHKRHPSDAFDVISIRLVGRGYDGVHGSERYRYIDMGYGILTDKKKIPKNSILHFVKKWESEAYSGLYIFSHCKFTTAKTVLIFCVR